MISTLDDMRAHDKAVLVRVDYNLPMHDGKVTEATRLESSLPTLKFLREQGARLLLLSHFGRPKGVRDEAFSLRPITPVLAEALGAPVAFARDCIGESVRKAADRLKAGDVVLLENTRFHKGEEANDPAFAAALAALGALYVHDAFSVAHRAHASTEGVARLLPAFAGRAMQSELEALCLALDHPERPVMGLVGGAKVSSKIMLLHNLVKEMDVLAIGGAMAHSFLAAQGFSMGRSLIEAEYREEARAIMAAAEEASCQLILPRDLVVTKTFAPYAPSRLVVSDRLEDDDMSLDLGPKSIQAIITAMEHAKTLLWNGPLGAFENPPFDQGTSQTAIGAAALCQQGSLNVIAGGGDTVAAFNRAGVQDSFTHVSTAGGAFLAWLEGGELPGLKALEKS